MKKALIALFVLTLFGLGAAGLIYSEIMKGLSRPALGVQPLTYTVPPGANLNQVSEDLHKKGWLFHPKTFWLLTKLKPVPNKPINHGLHSLKPGMTPEDILAELQRPGQSELSPVSIPEGFTLTKIAARLEAKGVINSAARFLELANNPKSLNLPQLAGFPGPSLEGYLFPETYMLKPPVDEAKMIELMLAMLHKQLNNDPALAQIKDPAELHKLLTLASIVEREARRPEERPTVAGLYTNRLNKGMKLECDATVQYALPEYKKRVLNSDLQIDSPYNTYLHTGLPPGPIANPGLSAIQAANSPEQNDYLYMVARPDGSHRFGRTWAEHTNNVRVFRQEMRDGAFGELDN